MTRYTIEQLTLAVAGVGPNALPLHNPTQLAFAELHRAPMIILSRRLNDELRELQAAIESKADRVTVAMEIGDVVWFTTQLCDILEPVDEVSAYLRFVDILNATRPLGLSVLHIYSDLFESSRSAIMCAKVTHALTTNEIARAMTAKIQVRRAGKGKDPATEYALAAAAIAKLEPYDQRPSGIIPSMLTR